MNKPIIGVSIGDVNGIGPEIIIKTFENEKIFNYCTPVVYGSGKILNYYKKALKKDKFHFNQITDVSQAKGKVLNVINCIDDPKIDPGILTDEASKYAQISLESVVKDMKQGKVHALVTAPLNKEQLNFGSMNYPGHTEYLTEKFNSDKSQMILCNHSLRVALVTNHLSVGEIKSHITKELVQKKIISFHDSLKRDYGLNNPVIGVLALNPHAGDNGVIGLEEKEIIIPAIQELQKDSKMLLMGPYPADGLFGSGKFDKFDGILAMYHDQGLIPFKLISFGSGVNFTAGLSAVRTSPDHGTGYDIVGKNKASADSFRRAIFMALDVLKNRKEFDLNKKDPVKKSKLKEEGETAE